MTQERIEMMTHDDRDFRPLLSDSTFPPKQGKNAKQFMDELEHRAERMKAIEQSQITAGADGE
jgi:hypothetical protein